MRHERRDKERAEEEQKKTEIKKMEEERRAKRKKMEEVRRQEDEQNQRKLEEEQNRRKLENEEYQQRIQQAINILRNMMQKQDNFIRKYQQTCNRKEDEKKHKDFDVDLNVTLSTVDDESSVSSYTTDYKDIDSDQEITEYGTTRKMREHDSIEKNGWLQLQQNDIEQYMNNNRKDFMARDNFAIPLLNNSNPFKPLYSCKKEMNLFVDYPK